MIDRVRAFRSHSLRWLGSPYFTVAKWLALAAMLYLAIRVVEWTEVVADLSRISPAAGFGFLGLLLLSKLLYAWRWQLICAGGLGLENAPGRFLLRANLLSEFVGVAMPSLLAGDAVRVLKLSARAGQAARATAAVVADRLLGLVSMAFLAVGLLPQLGMSVAGLPAGSVWIGLAVALVGPGLAALWWVWRSRRTSLPRALGTFEVSPVVLISSLILSVVGHLAFAGGHYLLFRGVGPVSFLSIVAVTLTAQLARSVPVSLLGIGLSEGSLVVLASMVGIEPETALVVVVVALCGRYVFALAGLLIELWCDGRGFLSAAIRRTHVDLGVPQ